MGPVRILLLMTDGIASTGAYLRERIAHAEVYVVTTEHALRVALLHEMYHVVCIQQPLPWLPMTQLVRVLRAKLSMCPIIMLSHTDTATAHAHVLAQFADIPDIELQRAA